MPVCEATKADSQATYALITNYYLNIAEFLNFPGYDTRI